MAKVVENQLNTTQAERKRRCDESFYFEGFRSPNTTAIPDEVFDLLMAHLSEAELKVLFYIMRRTFGFKKQLDAISLNQFIEGIRRKDGTVLDSGTGLSKPAVLKGLAGLLEKGIIWVQKQTGQDGRNEVNVYGLRFAENSVSFSKAPINSQNEYSNPEYSNKESSSVISVVNNLNSSTQAEPVVVNSVNPGGNNYLLSGFSLPQDMGSKQNEPSGVKTIDRGSKTGQQPVVKNIDPQHDRKQIKSGQLTANKQSNAQVGNLAYQITPAEENIVEAEKKAAEIERQMQDFGLPEKTIRRLLATYPFDYLKQKIQLVAGRLRQGKINNPAGFLLWAIENNYRPVKPSVLATGINQFPAAQALLQSTSSSPSSEAFKESKSVGSPAKQAKGRSTGQKSNHKRSVAPLVAVPPKAGSLAGAGQDRTAPGLATEQGGVNFVSPSDLLEKLIMDLQGRLNRPDIAALLEGANLQIDAGQLLLTFKHSWQKRLITPGNLSTLKMVVRWNLGNNLALVLA